MPGLAGLRQAFPVGVPDCSDTLAISLRLFSDGDDDFRYLWRARVMHA